jgi:hypothetical protein
MGDQAIEQKNVKMERPIADRLDGWCSAKGVKQYAVVSRLAHWFLTRDDPEATYLRLRDEIIAAEPPPAPMTLAAKKKRKPPDRFRGEST